MDQDRSKLLMLREEIFNSRMDRRDVLKRAAILGLSAPVIGSLLAACGDDDDDVPTPTTAPAADPTEPPAEEPDDEEPTEEPEEDPTEPVDEPTEEPTEEPESDEADDGPDSEDFEQFESPHHLMGIEQEEGQPGGVMIEANTGDISNTLPVLSADTASSGFQSLMFEPMIQPNPETIEPVGRLATAWAVNEDATVWIFRLREGVTWHDGETFTAQDVKFTFETILNPDTGAPRHSDVRAKIESVEAIDDYTVQFNLVATLVDFPLDLGITNIVPEHIWGDVEPSDIVTDPGATGQDPDRIIGTGPFRFKEWITGTLRSVVRYDDYWDGPAYLDEYVISQVADQSAAMQQLITGEVDLSAISEASVPELEGTGVTVHQYPTLSFTFYGTNLDPERTPVFQDVEVRKALFHAIDREALIQSIRFGFGEVAVGTMPVLSWAYNPQGIENHYEYDPELAVELLESAGWLPGADGIREKDGVRLSFEMNTNAGDQVREAYLVAFQEYWREIGVEMQPNFVPADVLVSQVTTTFDFDVFLIGFSWPTTTDQAMLFACDAHGAGFNAVQYCNPEVDALLDQARNTIDQQERLELLTEFQNVLLDDLPMAIIDFPQGLVGVSDRVHNIRPNAVNLRFNVHHWWTE